MTTTRYEISATKGDKRIHVAFTARKTLKSLQFNMHNSADLIAAALGVADDVQIEAARGEMITLTDGTVIGFSGRTEGDYKRGQVA